MPNHYSMELTMYQYTRCGLDNVWLKNGFELHKSGQDSGLSIHNLDGLHRAIALTIIHSPQPISGQEFRFIRIELDLSQKLLGNLMDKSDQSIAKWEKGEQARRASGCSLSKDVGKMPSPHVFESQVDQKQL